MPFPVHDWQFWVATLAAVGALWFLIRRLMPHRARRRKGRRALLTVEGKPLDHSRSEDRSNAPASR
ncbi:MAG: hypothetical protein KF866_08555 [Phycisphaeraceae bacterium]|nr:hypothetical protein [Phycisphaeraceae bacterium]MCW5753928.1 hypothetical protein [Phycisphaeraceae bacterium]